MSTSRHTFGPEYVRSLQVYVAGRPISAVAREHSLDENKIIKLASNENPLGMPASARRAIEAVACIGTSAYPDPDAFALKSAIETAVRAPRSWITVGNGSNDLLEMAVKAFLEKGQSAIVSQYAFAAYPLLVAGVDARAIVVPASGFGHDLEAMLQAMEPDTRLIFIANPNNPTGTFCPPEEIRRFLERVPEHVPVVLDEAYSEYLPDDQHTDIAGLVAEHANLIVVRTFSKAYALASLRIGFAIAQEHLSEMLDRVRQPFNTSTFAQAAATAAIADREFAARSRAENFAGLQQLYDGLSRMGRRFLPSSGNFVLTHAGDGARVSNALLRRGIIVRPVGNYGLREWIRVSVGRTEDNQRFLESLANVMNMH